MVKNVLFTVVIKKCILQNCPLNFGKFSIFSYMDPMLEKSSKFLMQPLKAMRVTAFEIAYLSAYILWTVHGKP